MAHQAGLFEDCGGWCHGLRACILSMVGMLVGVVPAAHVGAAEFPEVLAGLAGWWVYSGGDGERQARLDAIEATVSQMAWIARGTARKRIRASTVIHENYRFAVNGDSITIGEDDFEGHTAPWDGTAVEIPKKMGGPATLTRSVEECGLRSHWQQKKGAGTETYRVAADGATLNVTVVISSPRLPSDIRYRLTYRSVQPALGSTGVVSN